MLRLCLLICDFDLKFVESKFKLDTARCSSASGTARGNLKGGASAPLSLAVV